MILERWVALILGTLVIALALALRLLWDAEKARTRHHKIGSAMQRLIVRCMVDQRAPTHDEYLRVMHAGEKPWKDVLTP